MPVRMSTYLHLAFVAIWAIHANGRCTMDKELKVSVASPTHLHVSWEDAFKDCEDGNIVATNVIIAGDLTLAQTPGSKEANVRANPCIRHSIRVGLYLNSYLNGSPYTLWSRMSNYNSDFKIEN